MKDQFLQRTFCDLPQFTRKCVKTPAIYEPHMPLVLTCRYPWYTYTFSPSHTHRISGPISPRLSLVLHYMMSPFVSPICPLPKPHNCYSGLHRTAQSSSCRWLRSTCKHQPTKIGQDWTMQIGSQSVDQIPTCRTTQASIANGHIHCRSCRDNTHGDWGAMRFGSYYMPESGQVSARNEHVVCCLLKSTW
jgi:hypothetical protein